MEPSERLVTIVEALAESTLDNTMESFGQNLENRLSNFDDDYDVAYEDGMVYALYDDSTNRFVGFQLSHHQVDAVVHSLDQIAQHTVRPERPLCDLLHRY